MTSFSKYQEEYLIDEKDLFHVSMEIHTKYLVNYILQSLEVIYSTENHKKLCHMHLLWLIRHDTEVHLSVQEVLSHMSKG